MQTLVVFEGDKTKGWRFEDVNGNQFPATHYGIPKRAHVRLESLPDQMVIYTGKVRAGGPMAIELDPGKYIASVVRLGPKRTKRFDDCSYIGTFYVDVTPEAWEQLKDMTPTLARVINTSEGPRWRCKLAPVTGCEFEGTSAISALLHQVTEHLGIPRDTFLANPRGPNVAAAMNQSIAISSNVEAVEKRDSRLATVFGAEVAKELENSED